MNFTRIEQLAICRILNVLAQIDEHIDEREIASLRNTMDELKFDKAFLRANVEFNSPNNTEALSTVAAMAKDKRLIFLDRCGSIIKADNVIEASEVDLFNSLARRIDIAAVATQNDIHLFE